MHDSCLVLLYTILITSKSYEIVYINNLILKSLNESNYLIISLKL